REPDYIPRPRNAYIMFRSYYIQTNCGSGKKKQDDISKVASNVWNNMTEEEKQPFIQAAFEEKIQHKLKYPDYKYKP
ncbi:HMG-box, partial [Pholiota conissans]